MSALVYVCPKCGSVAVTPPTIVGGNAKCAICGWSGTDACVMPMSTGPFASDTEAVSRFCEDLINTFSRDAALPLGRLLVSWGFVSVDKNGKPSRSELAGYIGDMAKAMAESVLDRQLRLERERVMCNGLADGN